MLAGDQLALHSVAPIPGWSAPGDSHVTFTLR
jgi:hypothetical protein